MPLKGPLVSCVLPTKNRAAYIPHAIRSYQSQTYPARELVIVDNGVDATASLIPPDDPSIRYVRVAEGQTTGAMRNLCAQYAHGEILCHFDSDDWSAPTRVADQVLRLGDEGVMTGYSAMLFYDERDGKGYLWGSPQPFALGTSLCYRRAWWQAHPFALLQIGEDVRFFREALRSVPRQVRTVPAGALMVARIHADQTCVKTLTKTSYVRVPPTAFPPAYPCNLTSSRI